MPRATISAAETHRYDLKTAPPDGYVVLRPLTYQQMLHRQDGSSKMRMEARRRGKRNTEMSEKVEFDIMQQWTREYEFSNCIVDHNLEDENGNKLDFKNKAVFAVLNPKIGEEIENLIDDLNQVGDEEPDDEGGDPLEPTTIQTDTSSD